ncbi:Rossmann-like and DUF2520 domain-containing protein [Lewinella cohaerens]|uniref:Rossmann-like and DUF2520 domain-containing protein n=1 Tax=Lewinella cohaerens TaxID=70995 RepID=UPI000381B0B2|nr:Rossmann-like and DUF2520 domain-containing protein [Lewinella cohaerens]
MSENHHIVLIGAGNVAWHMGHRFMACGHNISFVYSRTAAKAEVLGKELNCPASAKLAEVPVDADLYLLLVPDGAIEETASALQKYIASTSLVMHASGATPADVLAPYFEHYGVFYPLQTFSRERELDFTKVPLCLYTAQEVDYQRVASLAKTLVKNVYSVGDVQRAQLHLAAVFVNNFTNYLQYIGQEIAQENHLPATLLQPLLKETIAKLDDLAPPVAQTGPAIRNDTATIDRHLSMLKGHPRWATLYKQLSAGIIKDLGKK